MFARSRCLAWTDEDMSVCMYACVLCVPLVMLVCVFQIAAMQAGLVKVVPQAVLDLLTWQEVEKKVCGDPEITVEALKRLSESLVTLMRH